MSDSETNGNMGEQNGGTGSVEDLSEYTDADESVSAPTEILAEFLSAIMLKDYETALKYCRLILQYEPNNSTAREFYPFIQEKIELMREQGDSDDETSSDYSESAPSNDSNHSSSSGEESESKETDSDATTASYSSLEDEEADRENNVIESGNTSLTSNDIANGNTERAKTESLSEGEAVRTQKANENEELKRKMGNFIGCKGVFSSDQLKSSPCNRKCTNNDRLPVSNNQFFNDDVRNNAWPRSSKRGPGFGAAGEVAQIVDDVNHANKPLISGSESKMDSNLHELKKINVKCTSK